MPDVTLAAKATQAAPLDYPIPAAAELVLKALTADFDGTGAGSPFVPSAQILLPNNVVVGTFPLGQTVAAGASADVTWFPGVTGSGGSGSGIQFNTDNQGGYLDVTTNNLDPSGFGMQLLDKSGDLLNNGGINIEVSGHPGNGISLNEDTGAGISVVAVAGGGIALGTIGNVGVISMISGGNGGITIENNGGGGTLRLQCIGGDCIIDTSTVGIFLRLHGLPTANPGGTSRVWSNGGVLNIT